MNGMLKSFLSVLMIILMNGFISCQKKVVKPNTVVINTTMGKIEILLNPENAPRSVENFLGYVKNKFYNGTIFHRVMDGFMIQAGGFDKNLNRKNTRAPILNEAANGLKNNRGTVAYARINVINSATSQFFINHVDNNYLDFRDSTNSQTFGYAVFGKVVNGMDVVDKVAKVKVGNQKGMQNVPVKPVIIKSVVYLGE